MDADLVGAAGFRPEQQKGAVAIVAQGLIRGAGIAAMAGNGHLRAVAGVAADVRIDDRARPVRDAISERKVRFTRGARLELGTQGSLRGRRFGQQQDATCIAVQAVDDAGPLDIEAGGQAAQPLQHPERDSGAGIAGGTVDSQPGRLIDGDEPVIFEQHGDIEVRRDRLVRRFRDIETEFVARLHLAGFSYRFAVDRDVAAGDEPLQTSAAQVGVGSGEDGIYSSGACGSEFAAAGCGPVSRVIAHRRRHTPIVMAESATLNAGQCGTLMKSTTCPLTSLSMRLPTAPPSISARPARISGWANPGLNR